jgi:hypothetical protein
VIKRWKCPIISVTNPNHVHSHKLFKLLKPKNTVSKTRPACVPAETIYGAETRETFQIDARLMHQVRHRCNRVLYVLRGSVYGAMAMQMLHRGGENAIAYLQNIH